MQPTNNFTYMNIACKLFITNANINQEIISNIKTNISLLSNRYKGEKTNIYRLLDV